MHWYLFQLCAIIYLLLPIKSICNWEEYQYTDSYSGRLRNIIHRPHPNECSGGDLDGDLFFISWDKGLIPSQTVSPMDYLGRRPRIMDHNVTLEVLYALHYGIENEFPVISNS